MGKWGIFLPGGHQYDHIRDDKFELCHTHAGCDSICGTIGAGYTCVFMVYPFQVAKMKIFYEQHKEDVTALGTLLAYQILFANRND